MSKRTTRATKKRPGKQGSWTLWAAAIAVVIAGATLWGLLSGESNVTTTSPIELTDVRASTAEYIRYNRSIELTAEQETIKKRALSKIRAPCCRDNTAYTCCCPCNMAKSWWGLANHLIADEGYGAKEVQAAVEGWIEFINPDGFSGNSCYTGRCSKPFAENGCGGMNEQQIIF